MGNLKVTMTDVNGVTRTFDNVEEGTSLMELGKQNDIAGIMGDCGGGCACATCHVYVDDAWFAKVGEPTKSVSWSMKAALPSSGVTSNRTTM